MMEEGEPGEGKREVKLEEAMADVVMMVVPEETVRGLMLGARGIEETMPKGQVVLV